ncbi:MAG TPA: HAD hydrolase family protein [Dehalococcoidia bacterium]|nr:HAD hydrolase family protein [Dehalococcoidia bacterium]
MNLPDFDRLPDAIALDLDGTLFNNNEEISPRNRAALERCIDSNIPIILATSRPARSFHRSFPADLSDRCSQILTNGSVVVGKPPLSGSIKESIPEAITQKIVGIVSKVYPDAWLLVEIEGYEFGANWTAFPETLWKRNSATPEMLLSIEEAIVQKPSKIVIGGIGDETLPLLDKLMADIGDSVSIVPALTWHPILNITRSGVNKASAIHKLIAPAGKSLDNVVAFGDDLPDMDMLTECGIPVAMGNAITELKAACRYCTASNEEDGVALVLERIFC